MNNEFAVATVTTQPGYKNGHQLAAVSLSSTNGRSKSRFCNDCGYENLNGTKICLNCGTNFGQNCSACHQPIMAGSKFCGQCGTRITPNTSMPLPSKNGVGLSPVARSLPQKLNAAAVKSNGERREVTVLFLDITNFTATSYYLDNEDVYMFIDEAMSLLVEVLQKYEGTVDKFTGDGLMALFGAPVAHEDDPERAVRAALEMLTALKPLQHRLREIHGFEFDVRIGINTGLVIAGNLGSSAHMEYTVIGDTVNLASRLESAAVPGTILVSTETYQRTNPLFEYEILPDLQVKGYPHPVKAYHPIGQREKPDRVRGVPGLDTSFIGRDDSLAYLIASLKDVQEDGLRRISFVTGDAGVGKSRLVSEFESSTASSDIKIYRTGSLSYTRNRPLWLVTELIRDILQLPVQNSTQLQRQVLQNHLERLELAADDIIPYLGYALGLSEDYPAWQIRLKNLDPTVLQRQTHAALHQLFKAEAGKKPMVLIFEDLHWVDPASRDFLEFLIQSSSDLPILLILVSRQIERATILKSILDSANREPERVTDIQLAALSELEGQMLIDQLIQNTAPEANQLKSRIVKRSAGNPFYVEEIVRMLIDQDGLVPSTIDNRWDITPKATDLLKALPGTIKGLILARLDQLPEGLRKTLQKAAVIGDTFRVEQLEKLNGFTLDVLQTHLRELENRQFLMVKQAGDHPGYGFQHALLQEAVYGTLLKRDRRNLHTKLASAIANDSSKSLGNQAEVLAFHYARSNTPELAIPYLITAANKAMQQCAYEIAIDNYTQAHKFLKKSSDEHNFEYFEVQIGLGRALKFVGNFTEASRVLLDGIQSIWKSDLSSVTSTLLPFLVESLAEIADVRQREGNYDEAINYLDGGLQLLGEEGASQYPARWCSLMDRMAWVRFRQGHLEEAEALTGAAIEVFKAQKLDDDIQLATLHNTRGGVLWQQGHLDRATKNVEESLRHYGKVGYLWGRSVAYANLGVLSYAQGNWEGALAYYKQAYALQQTIGDIPHQAISLENLGLLHVAFGQHDVARQKLEHSLTIRQRLGDAWGLAQIHGNLAQLFLSGKKLELAVTHAEAALAFAQEVGSDQARAQGFWILALTQAGQGELDNSLKMALEALKIAQSGGFKDTEIDCLRTVGLIHYQRENYEAAITHLRQSLELSKNQNALYQQGQAQLELGRVYLKMAETEEIIAEAQKNLQNSVEIFSSLSAAHDLRYAQAELQRVTADLALAE